MEATQRIRLTDLVGEYATYYGIISRYSQGGSFVDDYKVHYWLQVAQALGIPAPHTDNHAGTSGGGRGEGQKTSEEQENFKSWFRLNQNALTSAEVETGGGSKGRSGKHHNQEQQLQSQIKKENKKVERGKEKQQNAKQRCIDRGEHYIRTGEFTCRNCGQPY